MTTNNNPKYIFIGAAWPYANGSLHLGHIASLLPADIIARYYRLKGDEVLFVSGSDCHGTPIVLAAEAEKTTPETVSAKYHQEFIRTLIDGLKFSYDVYTTTKTENHTLTVQDFFLRLLNKKDIFIKEQKLPYCPQCQRFLPDRYIEGICPKCNFQGARGDQCDQCGAILDPKDLNNPHCKICATTPEFKESKHFFLKLSGKENFIENLLRQAKAWRPNALGFTQKLIREGFQDRAITRDTDWGVDIPLKGYEDKKIYVWFDAVCGYLSASKELYGKNDKWKEFWENNAVHYYVHGKDNIPFHTIIWPIMLEGHGNLKLPDNIISSEYLTLEKKQFSKSRHWAVWAKDYLNYFESDFLRYYLTANGPETSDSDFSWKDFQSRINAELIGNFANFVNRTVSLIEKNFSGTVVLSKQSGLVHSIDGAFSRIGNLIERGDLREALAQIIAIAQSGNKYLSENEPWHKIKSNPQQVENVLANCALAICNLGILLGPFLPDCKNNLLKIIAFDADSWQAVNKKEFKIKSTAVLFKKIEDEQIGTQLKTLENGKQRK